MAKVHHSAIVTRDVEASLVFWRDGLGLEVLMDHSFEGPWPELFGGSATTLRSVFLGDRVAPESGIVELVDLDGMAPPTEAGPGPAAGFFLLSLSADLDDVLPRLAGLGLGGEPVVAPVGPVAPRRGPRPQRRAGRADGHGGPGEPGVADGDGGVSEAVGHWEVGIIGAGPGGLGLAIPLAQSGRRDFVLLRGGDGVGGTWRVNTYPGAACDVPSHLYSYSFALKPDWTKTYANQPEILQYFEDCADRFGIRTPSAPGVRIEAGPLGRGGAPMVAVDRRRGPPLVRRPGQRHRHVHDAVYSRHRRVEHLRRSVVPLGALGTRARPEGPAGRGDRHRGERGADHPRGGQGCAAGRRVPAHAAVDHAPQDMVFSEEEKDASPTTPRPWPSTAKRSSGASRTPSPSVDDDGAADALRPWPRNHIEYRINDEELKAKLTPDYPFGCKRTLVCSDFYKALLRDNVELLTDPIEHVTPGGVVTATVPSARRRHRAGHRIQGDGVPRGHRRRGPGRPAPARRLGRGGPCLHGPHRLGVPELLHDLRAQHEPGRQLDHRHPRSPGRLRGGRARGHGGRGDRRPPGASRRDGRLQPGPGRGPRGHAVAARMPELLQERERKIVTQLPQTSLWYAERTREFRPEEYERA